MAFFFDLVAFYLVALYLVAFYLVALYLVALYLVALYLVALYLVALPGGSTWWLYLVALPGASMCCTLHHSAPPITPPYQPSQNKMGQSFEIVVMIKKDSINTMQINGLRYVK